MTRQRSTGKPAFSIIESLVVMLIIILLASILVAVFLGRGKDRSVPEPKPRSNDGIEKPENPQNPEPVSVPRETLTQVLWAGAGPMVGPPIRS